MKFILPFIFFISIKSNAQIVPQGFLVAPAYLESVKIGNQYWLKNKLREGGLNKAYMKKKQQ